MKKFPACVFIELALALKTTNTQVRSFVKKALVFLEYLKTKHNLNFDNIEDEDLNEREFTIQMNDKNKLRKGVWRDFAELIDENSHLEYIFNRLKYTVENEGDFKSIPLEVDTLKLVSK